MSQNKSVKALRTPEERFANLPGFDYPVPYAGDLPGSLLLRCALRCNKPNKPLRPFHSNCLTAVSRPPVSPALQIPVDDPWLRPRP